MTSPRAAKLTCSHRSHHDNGIMMMDNTCIACKFFPGSGHHLMCQWTKERLLGTEAYNTFSNLLHFFTLNSDSAATNITANGSWYDNNSSPYIIMMASHSDDR